MDTFTPGQWFHGRIYEKRSDLSPDGKLMIYAARKEKGYMPNEEYMPSWTAVSRPPYLTALALWPGFWCYGGGLFFSDTKVWLNLDGSTQTHPHNQLQGVYAYSSAADVSEEVLLLRRLERDGWRLTQEWQGERTSGTNSLVTFLPRIHRKQNPEGQQKLTLTTTLSGFKSRDEFSVRYAEGADFALKGAEWADWDKRGRLVFAQGGRIFAQNAEAIGKEPPQALLDLNGSKPEPVEAPDWAKRW